MITAGLASWLGESETTRQYDKNSIRTEYTQPGRLPMSPDLRPQQQLSNNSEPWRLRPILYLNGRRTTGEAPILGPSKEQASSLLGSQRPAPTWQACGSAHGSAILTLGSQHESWASAPAGSGPRVPLGVLKTDEDFPEPMILCSSGASIPPFATDKGTWRRRDSTKRNKQAAFNPLCTGSVSFLSASESNRVTDV